MDGTKNHTRKIKFFLPRVPLKTLVGVKSVDGRVPMFRRVVKTHRLPGDRLTKVFFSLSFTEGSIRVVTLN